MPYRVSGIAGRFPLKRAHPGGSQARDARLPGACQSVMHGARVQLAVASLSAVETGL